jgi:tetratricopeptide (TPR) repeat protein
MRDTLDWSAQLLDGTEARLFGQLSVFHGGWTLPAAERVADLDDEEVVDTLSRLVDRSLVTTDGQGRMGMLETIREYAAERLAAAGDVERQAAADRHAAYYAEFAEEYGPMYRTAAVHADRELMNAEDANLTAALRHAQSMGDTAMLARLVVGLLDYWFYSGQLAQADRWVAVVRDAEADAAVRVRLLLSTGSLVLVQGADLPRAGAALAAAHQGAVELGDPLLIARSLAIEALAARYAGDVERALGLIEEAIVLAREAARPSLEEQLQHERGEVLDTLGRTDEALPLWHRYLAWAGDRRDERAYPLSNLALHAQESGDAATASTLITEALHWAVEGDAVPLRADMYVAAGLLELLAGRAAPAVDLLQDAVRLGHDCGQLLTLADTVSLLGAALVSAGDVEAGARLLGAGRAWRSTRGLQVVGRLQRGAIEDAEARLAALMPADRLEVELRRGERTPFASLKALQALAPTVVELRGVVIELDSTAASRAR